MHPEPSEVAAIPVFSGLTPEQAEAISRKLEIRAADPGERIVVEGSPGYFFLVLHEGTAAVTRGGEKIAELEPGDHFGEIAILGGGKRTATVTATTPCTLFVMFGTDFRLFEQEAPEAAAQIRRTMQARLDR